MSCCTVCDYCGECIHCLTEVEYSCEKGRCYLLSLHAWCYESHEAEMHPDEEDE